MVLAKALKDYTMDTYSFLLPNMQKEAADKLDDFLYGGNGF